MAGPYSKTYREKKKTKKRRRIKGKNNQQDARIKKLESMVYPSIEFKSNDILCTNAPISTSPYANYPMVQVAQGTASNQRIGDEIQLKSMDCSLSLTKGDSANVVRVIIAATPDDVNLVASDVLEYSNQTTHAELVFSSPYKKKSTNSAKTYTILYDKLYNIPADVSTIVDKFQCKLPKKGLTCHFQGLASQQPDNFNVSVIALSDSSATPHPAMGLVVRSRYTDL